METVCLNVKESTSDMLLIEEYIDTIFQSEENIDIVKLVSDNGKYILVNSDSGNGEWSDMYKVSSKNGSHTTLKDVFLEYRKGNKVEFTIETKKVVSLYNTLLPEGDILVSNSDGTGLTTITTTLSDHIIEKEKEFIDYGSKNIEKSLGDYMNDLEYKIVYTGYSVNAEPKIIATNFVDSKQKLSLDDINAFEEKLDYEGDF